MREVAEQLGRPLAQVALAWVAAQPGVAAPIIGARQVAQLADNLAALAGDLPPEQLQTLAAASVPEPVFPYPIFEPAINRSLFGGHAVQGWR